MSDTLDLVDSLYTVNDYRTIIGEPFVIFVHRKILIHRT